MKSNENKAERLRTAASRNDSPSSKNLNLLCMSQSKYSYEKTHINLALANDVSLSEGSEEVS